jgi:hypothetical protein
MEGAELEALDVEIVRRIHELPDQGVVSSPCCRGCSVVDATPQVLRDLKVTAVTAAG